MVLEQSKQISLLYSVDPSAQFNAINPSYIVPY